MARLYDTGIFSVNSSSGAIGVGYKLYFYTTGTSTLKNTYPTRADAVAATNPNPNPMIAAADGRWNPIWLTGGDYKVILKDFDDVTLETRDPGDSRNDDSADISFTQSGTGAVATTVQAVLRNLAVTPEQFGATGDGVTDDTVDVQQALDTGKSVYLAQSYVVSALTDTSSNRAVFGPGKLIKKANVDGRVLHVTGDNNVYMDFTIDGSAAAPTPGSANDTFRIQGGDRHKLHRIKITASKGTGIRIDAGADNSVIDCESLSAYHNNLLIANVGADRNRVIGGKFHTTTTQNNIFVTANDGGAAGASDFIYDNVIIGVTTGSAFDTGIEIGSHAVRTVLDDFSIGSSGNPGLLIRDAIDTNIGTGIIRTPALASQNANYDAISIITLGETTSWDTRTQIGKVIIRGAVKRAGIYISQSGVTVDGADIFDDITSVNATTGAGLAGYGITMAGTPLSDITVRNCKIKRFERGVDFNQDSSAVARNFIEVSDNTIEETNDAINGFNVTFDSGVIKNNRIRKVVVNALELTSATYAGELHYVENITDLSGYSAASPVEFNPASAERAGLLTEYRTKYLLVPENQQPAAGSAVAIATGDEPSWGTLVIRFLDNSECATFALGGRSGIGTATTSKLIGTTNLLDSTGSGGAASWSVYYDGSNNLILERRGANTGSAARRFKAIIRSEG